MDNLNFQGQFKSNTDSIKVNLALFHFTEESLHFIYSPDLDLTGYGNTKEEAKTSFKVSLDEFLRYTTNKKTLDKELKKLLRDNDYLIDIVNTKDFSKTSTTLHLPAFA